MDFNIWNLTYLLLSAMSLGIVMSKHGEKSDNYNFWTSLLATLITFFILYKGGFFN